MVFSEHELGMIELCVRVSQVKKKVHKFQLQQCLFHVQLFYLHLQMFSFQKKTRKKALKTKYMGKSLHIYQLNPKNAAIEEYNNINKI